MQTEFVDKSAKTGKNNKIFRAYFYVALSGILFATSCIFVHLLAPFGFSSLQMTAMRGIVSALVSTVFVLFYNRRAFAVKFKDLIIYASAGFFMYVTAVLYYVSMQKTSVATAVMLMYVSPVFTLTYSVVAFKEKLNFSKTIAVIGMISGCALVSGVIGGIKFDLSGVFAGILSAVTLSAYNIITKTEMKRKCDPVSAMLYCFIFMGVFSAVFSSPVSMVNLMKQNFGYISLLTLGIGTVTCAVPYFIYTLAAKELPIGTVSSLAIIDPMASTVYSIIIFNETLKIPSLIGIIIILISILILTKNTKSE